MSLRLAVARQQGLDDKMAAKVDRYEASDLAERHKVALRLADALMTLPGSISADLREQARRHFGAEQLLELTLDVMKWNHQKVSVALGTDHAVRPSQLTDLRFDADGRASY
jgi:alkylhydroperoxidase family enzyme